MDVLKPMHIARGSPPSEDSACQNRDWAAVTRDYIDGFIALDHQSRNTHQDLQPSLILITVIECRTGDNP
jgi:hypothetical protein